MENKDTTIMIMLSHALFAVFTMMYICEPSHNVTYSVIMYLIPPIAVTLAVCAWVIDKKRGN